MYKKFRRIPANENWNKYRCQRNKVTALKRQSLKDFCFDAASVSSSCSPIFWKKLRPLLPNSKSSVDTSSICLLENGRIVPDTSTSLNEYFTSSTINESVLTFSVDELFAIKTLLNLRNSATYDFCLAMADMDKLEQRRTLQSLILFFKCFKLDGPNYISKFFTPRLTKYNLRDSGLNVVQPPYNSLVMHNSFLYMIAHIWNQLPTVTKSSTTLAQFRARLNNVNFTGCQCMNCI